MAIYLELVNVAFCLLFLLWVLSDILRRGRRSDSDSGDELLSHGGAKELWGFHLSTVLSSALISVLYLGFGFYEYWSHGSIDIFCIKAILTGMTWVLGTVIGAYYRNKTHVNEDKRWPWVLILWWVYSTVLGTLEVSIYLISHFKSIQLFPDYVPGAKIVDFASLPLSIALCLSALAFSSTTTSKNQNGLKHPLLEKEDEVYGETFANAGIWSQLVFRWLNPLFKRGRIRKLDLHHIPRVPQSETAESASSLLQESLLKQKFGASSSLPKALASAVWKSLSENALFAGANTIASYMGPFLITNFVNFLSGKRDDSSYHHGLVLAFIFLFSKTVESLTQRQWYFGANRIGIRVRAALMVLVYKKSVSIKYGGPSNGKIINLVNVDVERVGDFCFYIHGVWLLPVQVFLALIILYYNLGAAPSLAALLSTILVMVSNTPLANKQERLHSKIMEAKDSRIKATSETLKSMRVLKLQSWEPSFLKKIIQLRDTERSWLKRYLYTCSVVAFLFWASPTLVSVATFGVCIVLKIPLTTARVLSALATFRILQEPIYNLPELITMIAQTKVSLDRIEEFIGEQEQKTLTPFHPSKVSGTMVEIEAGEYTWDSNNQKKTTIKIAEKMNIMKGQKVAICGSVGSGKSSLLSSMLGEIPRISGAAIKVYGSKAYVPQSAWIQTGTVRENVLFGKEMNKALYESVLEGCALNRDIEMWADGDLTVLGERGMNLSGGQKQRIQLARAVYSDSDVYVLDDPFSAVDAHTGAHLFQKCIMQLLSHKTVIYATHQLEFLSAADLVLVMKDGRIVQSGKYEELVADTDGELVRHMEAHKKSLNQVNPPQESDSSASKSRQIHEVKKEKVPTATLR